MLQSFSRATAVAALSAWALMIAVVPAHALVVSGTWDPPIGGQFTNVSWSGKVTINSLDTNCGAAAGCDSKDYYLDSAIVALTDGKSIETVAWDKRYLGAITSMSFTADGLVDGVGSELSKFFRPQEGPLLVDRSFFALSFFGSASGEGLQARLTYANCQTAQQFEIVTVGGNRYEMFDGKNCKNLVMNDAARYPAYVKGPGFARAVQAVPEPQTYALIFAAIAALGLATRSGRRV